MKIFKFIICFIVFAFSQSPEAQDTSAEKYRLFEKAASEVQRQRCSTAEGRACWALDEKTCKKRVSHYAEQCAKKVLKGIPDTADEKHYFERIQKNTAQCLNDARSKDKKVETKIDVKACMAMLQ